MHENWQQAEIHERLSICCYHGFADDTVSRIFREKEMCINARENLSSWLLNQPVQLRRLDDILMVSMHLKTVELFYFVKSEYQRR